jgi:hypothetical protein
VIFLSILKQKESDRSVGIETGYRLEGRGSIPCRRKVFSSPQCSDGFLGPLSLLSNGYRGLFLLG